MSLIQCFLSCLGNDPGQVSSAPACLTYSADLALEFGYRLIHHNLLLPGPWFIRAWLWFSWVYIPSWGLTSPSSDSPSNHRQLQAFPPTQEGRLWLEENLTRARTLSVSFSLQWAPVKQWMNEWVRQALSEFFGATANSSFVLFPARSVWWFTKV